MKIAFGSCNMQNRNQGYWSVIASIQPDLFVWLGDVIYANNKQSDSHDLENIDYNAEDSVPSGFLMIFVFKLISLFKLFCRIYAGFWVDDTLNPIAVVAKMFEQMKNQYDYAQFRKQVRVVGTWDDHDSCSNNAGVECKQRVLRRKHFLDFLEEPENSPRRNRSSGSIHTSYDFPSGDGRSLKLILLDNRSSRQKSFSGDILGEEQWKWLEEELASSTASIHVIGSGIQFLPVDKPFIEKWANFPKSYNRLIALLERYQIPGVLFISGDVHLAEMLKYPCSSLGYPLYELTSSGLTHSCSEQAPFGVCGVLHDTLFCDRFRVNPLSSSANQNNITLVSHDKDAQEKFVFLERNFGTILVDWEKNNIRLQARRISDGEVAFEDVLLFSQLLPGFEENKPCILETTWRQWPIEEMVHWPFVNLLLWAFLFILSFISFWIVRLIFL